MRTFNRGLHRLLNGLVIATVVALMVPLMLQILARYGDLLPRYIWTEEASRFLLVWMVMLGAMIGVRELTHFDVDVWPTLSRRANTRLRIVSGLFTLVFAVVLLGWGAQFVDFGWYQTSEIADLPMWTIFVAWPLTGLAWLSFGLEHLVDDVRSLGRGGAADADPLERKLESAQ